MFDEVRKLARSHKYQTLYRQSEQISHIRLFENEINFTKIQLFFLEWLSIYNSLYEDLSMGEKFISEEVIEDNLRTEAYLIWRKWKQDNEEKAEKIIEKDSKFKESNLPKIQFV